MISQHSVIYQIMANINMKPRKVKAKITRTVTEIAMVFLDKNGHVEEIEEIIDELATDDIKVDKIITTITIHDQEIFKK